MERRTISVKPEHYPPEFQMIVDVPEGKDAEDYVEEFLMWVLDSDIWTTVEWTFSTEFLDLAAMV